MTPTDLPPTVARSRCAVEGGRCFRARARPRPPALPQRGRRARRGGVHLPTSPADATVSVRDDVRGPPAEAVVKEREAAFRAYDDAVVAVHGAALPRPGRPNVFTASVGNLPRRGDADRGRVPPARPDEGAALDDPTPRRAALRARLASATAPPTASTRPPTACPTPTASPAARPGGAVRAAPRPHLRPRARGAGGSPLAPDRHRARGGRVRDALPPGRGGARPRREVLTARGVDEARRPPRRSSRTGRRARTATSRSGSSPTSGRSARRPRGAPPSPSSSTCRARWRRLDPRGARGAQALPAPPARGRLVQRHRLLQRPPRLREGSAGVRSRRSTRPTSGSTGSGPTAAPSSSRRWSRPCAARRRGRGLLTDGQVGNEAGSSAPRSRRAARAARVCSFGIGTNVSDALPARPRAQTAARWSSSTRRAHRRRWWRSSPARGGAAHPRREGALPGRRRRRGGAGAPRPTWSTAPWSIFARYAAGASATPAHGHLRRTSFTLRLPLDLPDEVSRPAVAKLWAAERIRDLDDVRVEGAPRRRDEAAHRRALRRARGRVEVRRSSWSSATGERRASGMPETAVVPVGLPAGWAMFDQPGAGVRGTDEEEGRAPEARRGRRRLVRRDARARADGRGAAQGGPEPSRAARRVLPDDILGEAGSPDADGPDTVKKGRPPRRTPQASGASHPALAPEPQAPPPAMDFMEMEQERASPSPARGEGGDDLGSLFARQLASGLWDDASLGPPPTRAQQRRSRCSGACSPRASTPRTRSMARRCWRPSKPSSARPSTDLRRRAAARARMAPRHRRPHPRRRRRRDHPRRPPPASPPASPTRPRSATGPSRCPEFPGFRPHTPPVVPRGC